MKKPIIEEPPSPSSLIPVSKKESKNAALEQLFRQKTSMSGKTKKKENKIVLKEEKSK